MTAHMRNPLGIDIRQPILSWNVLGGIRQSAYEVTAYCAGKMVWCTGKVAGSGMQTRYKGPAGSRDRIIWKVTVWDEEDMRGEESERAYFEYAFLEKSDFKAAWINPEVTEINPEVRQLASYLVKEFDFQDAEVVEREDESSFDRRSVRVYASAHGIYSLCINGKRVTGNVLSPGTRNVFGKTLAFWMQLEVDKKTIVMTDESWQAAQDGPVSFNDIQPGEKVDARKVPTAFHPVKVEDIGCDTMLCTNSVPVLEKEQFRAKLIRTPDGGQVLDFRQNMCGYVSFRLQAKAGQKIKMIHGEYLDADGNFSDENLKTIGRKEELHQVVEYICKDGENVYCPALCIFGFQMVKVETDIDIDGSEFTAHAVYSDIRQTGTFVCDNELVNRLVQNTVWSQKSNFVDIPMDCPQRERSGWAGDAAHYKQLAENAAKAYNYLEVRNGHISSGRQCRYVRPLYMGLLSDEDVGTAAKDLNEVVIRNNYHLNTGFLTTPRLCQVLADYGYVETAYKVLLQEDTPGWLFAVKNGATTIWESWEGYFGDIGVASLNHYSKGAVVSWLIGGICGIHVQGQEIRIAPKPCRLMKYAESTFDSPAGMVKSRWEYRGEQVEYTMEIPANTRARFIAPDGRERKLEAGQLTGESEPDKVWDCIHAAYPKLNVVMTMGHQGAWCFTPQKRIF